MKSSVIPGLLKCNKEATGAREFLGEERGSLECQGLEDYSALGMPLGHSLGELAFGVSFFSQKRPAPPLDIRVVCVVP